MNGRITMQKHSVFWIILILTALAGQIAEAGLSVYRGPDGEHTPRSIQNLKELKALAKSHGTISVWVDFGIYFEGNPELRTPQQVADEIAAREKAFAEIVAPIIAKGRAVVVELPEPRTPAPGYLLEVDHQGLKALAKNSRVQFIGHLAK